MLAIILSILFFICVITLVKLEQNKYQTYFTPFTLLAIPYLIIICYQALIVNLYGMDPISSVFLFYISVYLCNFYLIGIFTISTCESIRKSKKTVITKNKYANINQKNNKNKVIEFTSIIATTYLLIKFIYNMRGLPTLGFIVQEDFQTVYSSGGGFHLRLIAMIGSVYFLGRANRNNKISLLLGLYCLIPNFLTFVKGIVFIPVIGGVIANILINNKQIKVKNIVATGLSGILIFFLIYTIEISIWNPNNLFEVETYQLIYSKLNIYLISGVQSFNVNIVNNLNVFKDIPNPVYAVIINLLSKTGIVDRIETVNSIIVEIGYVKNYGVVSVNTNTYIGTLLLYCGPIVGLLVNSIISIVMHYYFWKAIKLKDSLSKIRYSLLVAGLVLGWFEYYYMHTFWIYLIVFFETINFFNKIKIRTNKYLN